MPVRSHRLQTQISEAERSLAQKAGSMGGSVAPFPLAPEEIAYRHYMNRLAFDEELRNDVRYANMCHVDEVLIARLRDAIAGRASNEELRSLVVIKC